MSRTNASNVLDRKVHQAKNTSNTHVTQGSRLGGDGAATRTRRGAAKNEDQSDNESQADQSSEEEEDEEEEDESDESEPSDENDPEKQRFMMKPPEATDFNADGTLKFQPKSKLLLKIDQMGADLDADEDDADNSFGDEVSDDDESSEEDEDDEEASPEIRREKDQPDGQQDDDEKSEASGGDGDEDEEEDEDEEDSPLPIKEKTIKKQPIKALSKQKEEPPPKKKKNRRNIVNVYCTEYDVVPKCAKKIFNCRLKYFEEDHEGAVNDQGEGAQKLSPEWDLTWHDLSISADFLAKMAPYQRVNQYPGIYVISRKHNLARNLMKMQRSFPEEYDFFPKTWVLPHEASDFRKQFHDKDGKPLKKKKTYIVKPDGLSQGQGIYLSRNCERVIKQCTDDGGHIVQQYLDKPHLVDDLKYDLRIYVLVYGLSPLRVYIHEQGIARFATEPYVPPRPSNIDNLYMHLTNYAINKNNSAFMQNQGGGGCESEAEEDDSEEESGHKRSLHAIMKILMQQGADPDKIMERIKDIIVKTVIVGQPYMAHIYRSCQPDDYDNSMCFQILGFDIMIDKHFRPWLIEVNQSPSFATDSALDYEVKKNVIQDAFKLLNLNQERREEMVKEKQRQMEERIFTGKQEKLDPIKKQEIKEERLKKRFEFENEQLRCGSGNNYELLFPSFFEEEKNQKYEILLQKANDNWDEFTCGAKGRKKASEMEEQNKKAELAAKKLQRSKERKFQNRAQKKAQGGNMRQSRKDMQGDEQRQAQTGVQNQRQETQAPPKTNNIDNGSERISPPKTVSKAVTVSPHSVVPEQPNNPQQIGMLSQARVGRDGSGSGARYPLVKKDTRQQQLVEFLKNQNTNMIVQQQSLESSRLDGMLRDHYGGSDPQQLSSSKKMHKYNQSDVVKLMEQKNKPQTLHSNGGQHHAANQSGNFQAFQVNKQSNPTNRMNQIHENVNMMRQQQQQQQQQQQMQSKQNQKSLAPLNSGPNNNIKNGSSYSGNMQAAQGAMPTQSAKIKESGEQRRLLQQHNRDMKNKHSGNVAHELLENDLIPTEIMTNSFSNSKYGQSFNAMAQKSVNVNENGNMGSKSSPPTTSIADSEILKSGYADSNMFINQTSTGVSKNTSSHVKAGSNTLSNQNRKQHLTSQQDTEMLMPQPTHSNEDLNGYKLASRNQAYGQGGKHSAQARNHNGGGAGSSTTTTADKGNIFNETPKLSGSTMKTQQQKQMFSAQSYTHKTGQQNMFQVFEGQQQPSFKILNGQQNSMMKQQMDQHYQQSPNGMDVEFAKKQNQYLNQWTPQTKINGSNKFPGLVHRVTNGTINSHDMNFNMQLNNGMMAVNGDKNAAPMLKTQMINQSGVKMPPPQFMNSRQSNLKQMMNPHNYTMNKQPNGMNYTNGNNMWGMMQNQGHVQSNGGIQGPPFMQQQQQSNSKTGNYQRMNGGGPQGQNNLLMKQGIGQEGPGGHQGPRPLNQEKTIPNTINLNTKNLMKPPFVNDQEHLHKQNLLGMQAQGFQVINQKIISMDNETQIPLVASSYNFAQQMMPKPSIGGSGNPAYFIPQAHQSSLQISPNLKHLQNLHKTAPNKMPSHVDSKRALVMNSNQQLQHAQAAAINQQIHQAQAAVRAQQQFVQNQTQQKQQSLSKSKNGPASSSGEQNMTIQMNNGRSQKNIGQSEPGQTPKGQKYQNQNKLQMMNSHHQHMHKFANSGQKDVQLTQQVNESGNSVQMVHNIRQMENKTMFFVPQGSSFNPNRRTCAGRKIA